MKKFKENFKKHWKLSLVLFVLLLGVAGATLWFTVGSNRNSEETTLTYTAYVQSETGTSLQKVYVMLCAEDGTEITWLPYVTNTSGQVQFVEGVEEGCYVKVVGVPIGYKLDESVKYTFDSFRNVYITLEEDDSVYIAQIGDTKFMSLSSALGVANASSEDVTIELMADVVMNTGTLKNGYGKNITIKGNGHTITTEGGNNSFLVNQTDGVVALENVKIKHKNTGATFQVNGLTTLSLTDVVIDATGGSAYNYALINTLAVDGTTTLNLTRVDVKMAVQTPAKANEAGIIRTGNTSGTKTVDINMVDCNFDTEGATGRQCIVVMKNTVANIKATNCSFKAGDSPAIWAAEQSKMQTLVMNNCKVESTISPHTEKPIKGYAAAIGNTYYLTFAHAAEVAAKAKSDVTIKAVADVTMKTCTIKNENGKLITVDGNGKTITTSGGSNAFILGNNVAFKNMVVNHKNTGSVFHLTSATNLKATDVTINATEGEKYNYTLVNTLAEGNTTVDFTRVNVKMAVESKGSDKYASVIRTGNTTETKTVVINLTDCNFDITKATGRSGIAIVPNTTATVNLKNTTIKTMDNFAIRSNEQDINWNNADTVLTSLDKTYQDYPVEYYLAKIGDVFYTLTQAVEVANAAKVDTEIKLLANYTIKSQKINNQAGKLVTLNGNGKTITTSGGSNAFQVGNKVALKNMTINHKETGSAIHVTDIATVDVSDVTIKATDGKAYDYALINILLNADGALERAEAGEVTTLNMNNVNVTMSVAGRGKGNNAIIRTGNEDAKTVNINLTNCNFDTEKATGRSGILVMKKTNATIKLTNTSIKTLDVPAVQLKDTINHQTMTVNDCIFDSVSAEYQKQPIKGYDAMVGNVAHKALTKAVENVEADGTITLLQNVSTGWVNIKKSCTIDGNGYTITANKGSESDNHTFVVRDSATDVTFKNMTLVHKRMGHAVRIITPSDVKMENVTIDATQAPVAFTEGLVTIDSTGTINLTWDKVNVDMDAKEAANDSNGAIIRTGVSTASKLKENTVNITIKDSKLDAAGAVDRHGIVVMGKTNANVSVENTKIKTQNVPAIKANNGAEGQAILPDSVDLICGKKADEQEGYKVKFGDTWFIDYDDSLWDAVKNASEDVAITLTEDTELNLTGLVNKNGKKITINTDGNRLETTGTKDASVTINSEATVTMTSKTVYVALDDLAREVSNATENATAIINADWVVDASSLANTNGKTVSIDSNDKTVSTTGALPANVTITSKATCVTGNTTYYATFTNALKKAREADKASVITLFDDVTVSNNVDISNTNNKAVTIDGNNKTYTITTNQTNALTVESNSIVTLQNIKLKHEAKQGTVMVKNTSTLNLVNVEIEATSIKDYEYGLINLFGKDGTSTDMTLNMTGVSVNMDGTTPKNSDNAIIRTGNGGAKGTKNVTITMTDCSLNTGSANNLYGIRIQSTTTADVTLTNTNITTKNFAPIYNGSSTSVLERTGGTFTCTDGNVKIGNTFYDTLQAALEVANAAEAATTIEICSDITEADIWADTTASPLYVSLKNASKKKITLDGNWCSLSINSTNAQNALRVYTEVEIKEILMDYFGKESVIKTYTNAVNLKLTNVDIVAKNTTTTETYLAYGIIYLDTKPGTNNFKVENTNITVEDGYNRLITKTVGVIRVNQSGTGDKTLNIEMNKSRFDATKSKGRMGIFICRKVDANITLIDSNIIVDNTNWGAQEGAAVYACTDAGDTRNLTLRGNTSIQTKTTGNLVLSGEASVSNYDRADRNTEKFDAASDTWNVQIEQAVNAIGLDATSSEPETKTLTLEVPVDLYDKLVEWIKQFADKWGWNTGL